MPIGSTVAYSACMPHGFFEPYTACEAVRNSIDIISSLRLAMLRRRPTFASSIFSSGNAGVRTISLHRPTTSAVFSLRQRKPLLA